MISLVAMDAGDGSREDFADWANAGFVLEHDKKLARVQCV